MATLFKRTIAFAKPQMDSLKKESKRLGISVAELVRRIIDDYFK